MKTIIEYINESNKIADPELSNDSKKSIAYDYNGDGWVVEAYCYADGGACEGCDSLEDLLDMYDESGAMKEMLDEDELDNDTIIVGAYMEKDNQQLAAWVWGYDGICYENK